METKPDHADLSPGDPANDDSREAEAVRALGAMAHEGRLRLLRLLIQAGPDGISAGQLASAAGIGATTASGQLTLLSNAGLIRASRDGRRIIYRARYTSLIDLISYLVEDCCGGNREVCRALLPRVERCC